MLHIAQPTEFKNELADLRSKFHSPHRFGRLIGGCSAMQHVYDQIRRVAPTTATILITGESGTGKELVAQTVHDLSRRHAETFIAVNCGAISPQLIESEIFGHEKGSFTGAMRDHRGHFERASGGTLFLDEITEMPLDLQVKLLRVIETRAFMRVGSDRVIKTDVRIIAATNREPEQAVAEGRLREDLMYRLQVFLLHMPPLRERGEDIEMLAQHFLDQLNREENTNKIFSPDTLDLLCAYKWPGNVRELKNVVHHSYIMANDKIDSRCLPRGFGMQKIQRERNLHLRVGMTVEQMERQLIFATLERYGGHKERTAEALGLSSKTLYNRLRQYENQSSS